MVRLLIASGADVELRAANQQKALDLALSKGRQAVVELLDVYAR
jgi:ankyrin repeat protein